MEEQADERGKYCWETCSTSAITTSVSSTFFCTSAASFFRLSNWVMMLQEEWVNCVWWQTLLHQKNIELAREMPYAPIQASFSQYIILVAWKSVHGRSTLQFARGSGRPFKYLTHLHSTVYLTLLPMVGTLTGHHPGFDPWPHSGLEGGIAPGGASEGGIRLNKSRN